MTKLAASKIIEGLKQALGYARCKHEFTYWAPREQWDGTGKQWWRRCTKCECAEVRHSETEPTN